LDRRDGSAGVSLVAQHVIAAPDRVVWPRRQFRCWLIGRSLFDDFSHVIATTAQICSGVCVAGAPDRGASAIRSQSECLSSACRHRLRQYRTVFGQTPNSRALLRTAIPSTACTMTRARSANYCGVEWVRINCSNLALVGQDSYRIGGQ
jgi:hypothetical protein